MMACTWTNLAPAGGLGTGHPATVQSVGRLAAAVCTHAQRPSTNASIVKFADEA